MANAVLLRELVRFEISVDGGDHGGVERVAEAERRLPLLGPVNKPPMELVYRRRPFLGVTTPAVISLSAAFSFGSGLTAEEPQALHRGLFSTTTNLQPRKRSMTNTLTEELRDTLLELVPSVLAAIEYTKVWQRDKLIRRRPRHASFTIGLCAVSITDCRSSPRSKSTAHSSIGAAGSVTTCSSGSPAAPTWGNCWRCPGACNEQEERSNDRQAPKEYRRQYSRTESRSWTALEAVRAGPVPAGAGGVGTSQCRPSYRRR